MVQEIFEETKSEILNGAIIWTPMLATDNVFAADECETKFSDSRVQQVWDPDRIFGRLMAQTLNLEGSTAWDVYLAYPPNHDWIAEPPPKPEFWMHQLDEEEPTLRLHPSVLKQYLQTLTEKL